MSFIKLLRVWGMQDGNIATVPGLSKILISSIFSTDFLNI